MGTSEKEARDRKNKTSLVLCLARCQLPRVWKRLYCLLFSSVHRQLPINSFLGIWDCSFTFARYAVYMPCRKLQRVTRERKLSSQSSLTCRKLHIGNKVGLKRSSCKKALLFFKRVGGNGFDSHIKTTKRTGCLLYLAVLVQKVNRYLLGHSVSKKKNKTKNKQVSLFTLVPLRSSLYDPRLLFTPG